MNQAPAESNERLAAERGVNRAGNNHITKPVVDEEARLFELRFNDLLSTARVERADHSTSRQRATG